MTSNLVSATSDPELGRRFVELRGSSMEHLRGVSPAAPLAFDCDVVHPRAGPQRDGPVFRAADMETRWDVALFDDTLSFAHSWTGEVLLRARLRFSKTESRVTHIEANSEFVRGNREFARRLVDFLVRALLFQHAVPLPLPPWARGTPEELALHAFSLVGSAARFASFIDTTRVAPRVPGTVRLSRAPPDVQPCLEDLLAEAVAAEARGERALEDGDFPSAQQAFALAARNYEQGGLDAASGRCAGATAKSLRSAGAIPDSIEWFRLAINKVNRGAYAFEEANWRLQLGSTLRAFGLTGADEELTIARRIFADHGRLDAVAACDRELAREPGGV